MPSLPDRLPDRRTCRPTGRPAGRPPVRRLAAAAVTATALLSGCASPDLAAQPAAETARCSPVVFVVSGRMSSPAAGLTTGMSAAAARAVSRGAALGLVDLDGQPRLLHLSAFSDPGVNAAALQQARQNFLSSFAAAVARTRAVRPHADVLDALDVAGRAIRGQCGHGGTVYLEDSGLQETGALNFRVPGTLAARPADVVAFLRRDHELPDLAGISVVLAGIGDTAPPQQPLSIAQRANLIAIWSAVATASGAGSVGTDPAPRAGIPAPARVPPVLPVPVPTVTQWVPGDSRYPFRDSGPVGFQANTAAFRDPAAATAALAPVAQYLMMSPGARIELTGTTARWGTLAADLILSQQRAAAVKAILVRLGAGASQITTQGLAWRFPGYRQDQGPDGALLPGPAEHNRSVIVSTS